MLRRPSHEALDGLQVIPERMTHDIQIEGRRCRKMHPGFKEGILAGNIAVISVAQPTSRKAGIRRGNSAPRQIRRSGIDQIPAPRKRGKEESRPGRATTLNQLSTGYPDGKS